MVDSSDETHNTLYHNCDAIIIASLPDHHATHTNPSLPGLECQRVHSVVCGVWCGHHAPVLPDTLTTMGPYTCHTQLHLSPPTINPTQPFSTARQCAANKTFSISQYIYSLSLQYFSVSGHSLLK